MKGYHKYVEFVYGQPATHLPDLKFQTHPKKEILMGSYQQYVLEHLVLIEYCVTPDLSLIVRIYHYRGEKGIDRYDSLQVHTWGHNRVSRLITSCDDIGHLKAPILPHLCRLLPDLEPAYLNLNLNLNLNTSRNYRIHTTS